MARLYDAGRLPLAEIDVLEYRLITTLLRAEADAQTDARDAMDAIAAAMGGKPPKVTRG